MSEIEKKLIVATAMINRSIYCYSDDDDLKRAVELIDEVRSSLRGSRLSYTKSRTITPRVISRGVVFGIDIN